MALGDLEMNAVAAIYRAMTLVNAVATDTDQPREIRSAMNKLHRQLDTARGLIMEKQVEKYVGDLEVASKAMDRINTDIADSIKGIQKLAKAIDDATKAVAFIVNTAKSALSSGLL